MSGIYSGKITQTEPLFLKKCLTGKRTLITFSWLGTFSLRSDVPMLTLDYFGTS